MALTALPHQSCKECRQWTLNLLSALLVPKVRWDCVPVIPTPSLILVDVFPMGRVTMTDLRYAKMSWLHFYWLLLILGGCHRLLFAAPWDFIGFYECTVSSLYVSFHSKYLLHFLHIFSCTNCCLWTSQWTMNSKQNVHPEILRHPPVQSLPVFCKSGWRIYFPPRYVGFGTAVIENSVWVFFWTEECHIPVFS